jgi:hypothetical protein
MNGLSTFTIRAAVVNTLTMAQQNYLIQNGWKTQSNGNMTKVAPLRAYYMLNMSSWLKTNNIPYEISVPTGSKSMPKAGNCGRC